MKILFNYLFQSIISPSDYLDYLSKQSQGYLSYFRNQNDILIYLAKNNYLKNWINLSSDSLYIRINCLVKVSGSHQLENLLNKFHNTLNRYFNKNQYKIVGLVSYLVSVNRYITESFTHSFAGAFLIVFTILFLLSQCDNIVAYGGGWNAFQYYRKRCVTYCN